MNFFQTKIPDVIIVETPKIWRPSWIFYGNLSYRKIF